MEHFVMISYTAAADFVRFLLEDKRKEKTRPGRIFSFLCDEFVDFKMRRDFRKEKLTGISRSAICLFVTPYQIQVP